MLNKYYLELSECIKLKIQIKISPMASEKKIKIHSLLSLNSLTSLPGGKKHLLKPLQLSDVIVAMVEEQLSTDRTTQLKSYLTKNRKKTIDINQQQELIESPFQDLPDFAKKQWDFTQLLKYHIEKKKQNPKSDIELYEKKLFQIQKQFSNALEKYKYELEDGRQIIENIESNINKLYEMAIVLKKKIKETKIKIGKYNQMILLKIKKQQNLLKTIAIAKAWSKSNISKVLSRSLQQIEELDIVQILQQIQKCCEQIRQQGRGNELENSDKVLKVIQQRRTKIVQKVEKNMLFSIINYASQETYNLIYNQYNQLLLILSQSTQKYAEYHILEKNNIQQMIQDNLDHVYWSSVEKVSTINNVELLREETYLAFFSNLLENYRLFILKWHKVTSFHVNNTTQHKDSFIKMLPLVTDKILKTLFHLLKYSQKFFSFSFQNKLKIIIDLNKLLQFIEEWTGKKDISLFQLLREKFRTQIQNFRKQANGFLKLAFAEEFSEDSLMPRMKRKQSNEQKEQKLKSFRILDKQLADQKKIEKQQERAAKKREVKKILKTKLFIQTQEGLSQKYCETKIQSIEQLKENKSIIKQFCQQPFQLNICQVFVSHIVQYYERQQILPFGHLDYILEHIDFLILLIFKVCVYEDTKHRLFQDFSERTFTKLKELDAAIQKNPNQEGLISLLAKMRQSFLKRKSYLQLQHYLSEYIDTKFDNIVVSGFVNINKLFQNIQQNHEFLTNYHIKLVKLIEQLLKITKWLTKNQQFFNNYQNASKKLQRIPSVLIQLALLYFQEYNLRLYHKYLDTIQPLMKNLKWKIEKFNQEITLQFRQYKINILQIYRTSALNFGIKDKLLSHELTSKHLQVFYKALLQLYCKIDKINDNGRQVLRLESIEISKILKEVGYEPGSWCVWFEKFIETIIERSIKIILQKIEQLGIVYPIECWKSQILSIISNLSSKEKKQYHSHLLKIYSEQLKRLPQL